MDAASCTGCHQRGSMAGFHFLGLRRLPHGDPQNRFLRPGSPLFHAMLSLREGGRDPLRRANAERLTTGAPMEIAAVGAASRPGSLVANANPRLDTLAGIVRQACGSYGLCLPPDIGSPDGMCTMKCESEAVRAGGTCLTLPSLSEFTDCMERTGNDFGACLATAAKPTGAAACSATKSCRSDYACVASLADPAGGVCTPPYFLPRLNLDAHPRF